LEVKGRAHAKYIAIKINSGKSIFIHFTYFKRYIVLSFLPLGATVQGELWPPEQSASIPSEADYLVSEQFNFYGVSLLESRPIPNLEDQGILLHLAPTP
jgi:hypothetical protein